MFKRNSHFRFGQGKGDMRWIHDYQLFLFDFDGLLVNTEELHYKAYQRMCAKRGLVMDMGFQNYCKIAHYHSIGLSEELYKLYPELRGISWDVLYAEKKQEMVDLLNEGKAQLMPGVERLLAALQKASIPRCVVTHSPTEIINAIRKDYLIFDTIPFWITREQYTKAKPDPECYIKAVEMLAKPSDKIIGFEDTPRGLKALLGTRAKPVLICQTNYPEIPEFVAAGIVHYPSFLDIPDSGPQGTSLKAKG
jgi:beta-phosphoglucomutase